MWPSGKVGRPLGSTLWIRDPPRHFGSDKPRHRLHIYESDYLFLVGSTEFPPSAGSFVKYGPNAH